MKIQELFLALVNPPTLIAFVVSMPIRWRDGR